MKPTAHLGPFVLALALTPLLAAQVSVDVDFEYEQYLANEPLRAAVRIHNMSGQTLQFGSEPGWLDINVESNDGLLVTRSGDPPTIEPFEVPSAARGTRRVDLIPYFDMGRPGRYFVTAIVRVTALGRDIASKPTPIIITSGARIWEQEFGNPGVLDDSGVPEVRRYALVQAVNSKVMRLYVRVSDRYDSKAYRVLPIGPVLTFSHPEVQIDRSAQLHVLWQTSARVFDYVIVNPDGDLLRHNTYQYTATRPVLRAQDDGSIIVTGGNRLRSPEDIPKEAPPPEPTLDQVTPVPVPPPAPPPAVPATQGKKQKSKKDK